MDDKSLNLWRQIDGFRRRGPKRVLPAANDTAPAAVPEPEPSRP
jgi:hypothetical protein